MYMYIYIYVCIYIYDVSYVVTGSYLDLSQVDNYDELAREARSASAT